MIFLSFTSDTCINPAETGLYYLGSRYYSPQLCRFISADDIDILEVQDDLYDKNLYAYCDNNPVMRKDVGGDIWSLTIVGGGTIAGSSGISITAIATGLSVITPIVIAASVTVVAVVSISTAIKYAKSKANGKAKENVDPYARPGQKKQGRENKNKSRKKDNFKSKNNRRDNMPAKPKKHTPSRKGHTKYYP